MSIHGHTKGEVQSWDAQMEALGDRAEHRQPRQLREQIHSSKLKMKKSKGCAMPVKQHREYHLAVKVVREREQEQRIAGSNSLQDEQQTYPSTSSSSRWDGWWASSWLDKTCQWSEKPRWF